MPKRLTEEQLIELREHLRARVARGVNGPHERMVAALLDHIDTMGDPAVEALDAIAAMTGCPEWDYPGQVVRDVRGMRHRSIRAYAARLELRAEYYLQAPDRPEEVRRQVAWELLAEALLLHKAVPPLPGEQPPTMESMAARIGLEVPHAQ